MKRYLIFCDQGQWRIARVGGRLDDLTGLCASRKKAENRLKKAKLDYELCDEGGNMFVSTGGKLAPKPPIPQELRDITW